MESLLFEREIGVRISDLKTIDDINKAYERKTGRKVTYHGRAGVWDYDHSDPDKMFKRTTKKFLWNARIFEIKCAVRRIKKWAKKALRIY